jgi:hypothetical protein
LGGNIEKIRTGAEILHRFGRMVVRGGDSENESTKSKDRSSNGCIVVDAANPALVVGAIAGSGRPVFLA